MSREGRDIWLTGSFSALSKYTTNMAEEGGSPALLVRLSFLFRIWGRIAFFFNVNVWHKGCVRVRWTAHRNLLYSRITSSRVMNQWKWGTQTCSSRSVLGSKDNHSSLKWTRPDGVSFKVNHWGDSRRHPKIKTLLIQTVTKQITAFYLHYPQLWISSQFPNPTWSYMEECKTEFNTKIANINLNIG